MSHIKLFKETEMIMAPVSEKGEVHTEIHTYMQSVKKRHSLLADKESFGIGVF